MYVSGYFQTLFKALADKYEFKLSTPWRDLPERVQTVILTGLREPLQVHSRSRHGREHSFKAKFEGAVPYIKRRYHEAESENSRERFAGYMREVPCPTCKGARLKPSSLAVTVSGRNIAQVSSMAIDEVATFMRSLELTEREAAIAERVVKEINERLRFLLDVGLDYLTLSRSAGSLSGGEAQRIRLATQIGSGLVGVLYVLDEPSIGLHQRDNRRLIDTLVRLRDLGNTLIVVEHDEDTIRTADWAVDIGPGAGEHGGHVVVSGTVAELLAHPDSLTGAYLSGRRSIPMPGPAATGHRPGDHRDRRPREQPARRHGELSARPVHRDHRGVGFRQVLPGERHPLHRAGQASVQRPVRCRAGTARSPASSTSTRRSTSTSRRSAAPRGPIRPPTPGCSTTSASCSPTPPRRRCAAISPGRFSFNVKGGRCENCAGDGTIKIEMNFLPDVYVPCEVCHGARYNRETLEVHFKGRTIAEVLDMPIEEAVEFFAAIPAIARHLRTLVDVGLGYVRLGQPATTLSGGEAQRVKLASELQKRSTGRTMYVLDEPTTGLHFEDIRKLLGVLGRLVDAGNTVVVIEHNLDVIKTADWVIDMGPEGGSRGGLVIAEGTPEQIAASPVSHTGEYLRPVLEGTAVQVGAAPEPLIELPAPQRRRRAG